MAKRIKINRDKILAYLDPGQLAALRMISKEQDGAPVAALIRKAISEFLEKRKQ